MSIVLRNTIIVAVLLSLALAVWWLTRDGGDDGEREDDRRPVPALVMQAGLRVFLDEIEALGTTRAAESVDISARVSNVITAISFDEGQRVERGHILVDLENSEATANHAAAQAALVESRSQYQRSRELLRTGAVSASRVEELEAQMLAHEAAVKATESRLQDHRVKAPFTGYTGLRRVSLGTLLAPGTVITTLDDISTVLLDFDVPETFLGALAVGQELTARSAAYPGVPFSGVVATIDSRVDPVTRAVTVRARLPNDEGSLRPGMFMTVRVLRERAELLLVPEQAVVPLQARKLLYVVKDGIVETRDVTTGRRMPGWVEVTDGIEVGETLIVEGTQRVRDGSRVEQRPWRETAR